MLTFIIVIYLFSKWTCIAYLTISYLLSMYVYVKSTKYFYPDLTDLENPYYHEKYKGFKRSDGHHISLGRILWGVLGYLWIRIILIAIIFVGWYLYFK